LRSENGGEYTSSHFIKICEDHGIARQYMPYTLDQNGMLEWKNHTLVEAIHNMLARTKLPQTFWAKAITTSYYIQNHCCTCFILDKKPFELCRRAT
jgi:transposase InsO family protein